MTDLAVIVEGETEQAFVSQHLATYLGAFGVSVWARLPGRVKRRGGIHRWPAVRGDILRTLKERGGRCCTTMFDFYGMPTDWPGRAEAAGMRPDAKGAHVEEALLDDLAAHAGADFRRELFIPYVQVHEFEALLFADVAVTARTLATPAQLAEDQIRASLQAILDEAAGQAEAINDDYETCPSRRILGVIPAYNKRAFGPTIVGRIGMEALRAACPHFGQWIARLEALA